MNGRCDVFLTGCVLGIIDIHTYGLDTGWIGLAYIVYSVLLDREQS